LLTRDHDGPYYYLPGGKLKLNETTQETLVREMREELHENVTIDRLLWVAENFFVEERTGERVHEFSLYYLIHLPPQSPLPDQPVSIFHETETLKLEMGWVELSELKNMRLFPKFLQEKIFHLPEYPEQIIINELTSR
jgi:ADP-ribose pyrophosphatase YjhB (NUDIX family)